MSDKELLTEKLLTARNMLIEIENDLLTEHIDIISHVSDIIQIIQDKIFELEKSDERQIS